MANPVVTALPAGAWTRVATSVTDGNLYFKNLMSCTYLQTYRQTGDSAPSVLTDGVPVKNGFTKIDSAELIDVYIYCSSPLSRAGSVRVAL